MPPGNFSHTGYPQCPLGGLHSECEEMHSSLSSLLSLSGSPPASVCICSSESQETLQQIHLQLLGASAVTSADSYSKLTCVMTDFRYQLSRIKENLDSCKGLVWVCL